jgi:hypothetical protein
MDVGMPVHIVIDISPETFQLLPFGGLRGMGKIVRIEKPEGGRKPNGGEHDAGVAVSMTSRLRFDPELHLPRFEAEDERPC